MTTDTATATTTQIYRIYIKAAPEQDLAAKVELLGSLVAGVDAARRLQPLEFALVEVESLGLANHLIRLQSQPIQVVADRLVEFGGRALAVGVVDPQDEGSAMLLREQIVVQRGADVADVQPARRRRGEAGDDAHRGSFTFGPVWKKLLIG